MQQTIAEVFGIKQPLPTKTKNNPDTTSNNDLMIGVELEVENAGADLDGLREASGRFWNVTEDRSLRPHGVSWEWISKPALMGTTMAEMRLLFEKMGWGDANYSDRTSVHVHTNVLDFTQQQVANLTLVYPVVESVLFRFVNHYKKREEQGYCRDTNLYCVPWSDCRMNRNFIEKFFDNPAILVPDRRGLGIRAWEKYTALNFLPMSEHGTVEWRHMHGTADMEKLGIWLNLIGSIMRYCRDNKFDDIVKTIKVMNDVSTYQQFFQHVLGNSLEYKEEYRAAMAEGVVNAKYSLVNWEANKNKPKPEKPDPKIKRVSVVPPQEAVGQFRWDTWEEMRQPTQPQQPLQPDPVAVDVELEAAARQHEAQLRAAIERIQRPARAIPRFPVPPVRRTPR